MELTFAQWQTKYQPKTNQFAEGAAFGMMFETDGAEVEFVKSHAPQHIWTWVDDGEGGSGLSAGWHFVNRLGYFVTEEPWTDENEWVQIDTKPRTYVANENGDWWEFHDEQVIYFLDVDTLTDEQKDDIASEYGDDWEMGDKFERVIEQYGKQVPFIVK